MAFKKLDKAEWKALFDQLSTTLAGKPVEIEVASLAIGDQIAAQWVPFCGITYDPKDDLIEVVLEGLKKENIDHLINHPRDVYVDITGSFLRSLAIVDSDGVMQIITMRDPVRLFSQSGPSAEAG